MISREEAETMLAADALAQHDAALAEHRRRRNFSDVRGWKSYVSLPVLAAGADCGLDFSTLFRDSIIVVHPGYHLYLNNWKPADGYMELYMGPLKAMIASAKDAGHRVLVYAESRALKETLDIVGPQGTVLVPTMNGWAEINYDILGCVERSFVRFLRRHGLERTEVCGELSGACVSYAGTVLEGAGIEVKYGISYPDTVQEQRLQQPQP